MRIEKIIVNKLFGIFDHEISLNMSDRITILHGKNGVGKTAVLRLINGFFNSRYSELREIRFEKLTIFFDDKIHLIIQQTKHKFGTKIKFLLLNKNNRKLEDYESGSEKDYQNLGKVSWIEYVAENDLNMKQIGINKWASKSKNEIFDAYTIVEQFSDNVPDFKEFQIQHPNWLNNLKKSIYVILIESQRLLKINNEIRKPESDRFEELPQIITLSSVESCCKDLAENIQNKLAEYGKLSQSLDRNFLSRVFESSSILLTDEQLQTKFNKLENQRNSLIDAGLLNKDKDPNFQIPDRIEESTRKLLSVYIEDIENKLNIFKEIAEKIEVFKRIINEKFSYKEINIDQEKGFIFTTENGENLSPTDLSSGEQHELVMLYDLLFKVKPNSLILIDEPELSLHMAWKIQFLKDLAKITELANIDIIIATHSASLINDRWDLTVELKR